jgi:branched-subunit amino acid transport protein
VSPTIIWITVFGMAITNITLRLVPVAVLSRFRLPRPVERWLSYVPACVMASIVATEVLHPAGHWPVPWQNPYLLAAIPTALVYRYTKSLFGATVAGVLAFLAMRYLLG